MNVSAQVGQPITRREDQRFLTGRGRYAENTAPIDGAAVLFVRSPHAHALIKGIDRTAAPAVPGGGAGYTAEGTPARKLRPPPARSRDQEHRRQRHPEPAPP